MSNRGRGRGGGVQSTDRASSSSSATSSRSPSLTRPTTSTTTQDTDRLMKQLKTQLGTGSTIATGVGARTTTKYMPNLAASKKDKDKTDSTNNNSASGSNNDIQSINKKDHINNNNNKPQTNRGRGGNYRGGHSRDNYIQTKGIFEEGKAQIPVAPTTSSFSSRTSIKTETSTSNRNIRNIEKLGIKKTKLIGDVDGLKYEIDEENEPRLIPLAQRKSVFDIKKEPNIIKKSTESISNTSEHINSFIQLFSQQKLDSSTKSIVKDEPMEPTDIPKSQESINDSTQLILMQFPDVLPCTRTSSSTTKPELVSLSDLPDGFLGKLQIYKSGKCRLKLNDDTYLDVDIGQPTSFLQNVMVTEMASTNIHDEHETNNDMNKLVCLGDIKHKLIVSLDAEHVFQDTRQ
ncbi:unnamed protein product [Rotaria sp. Silwood1]|nr:unnamed protein product [Rotaria sp. Silwood1]CAF1385533.1 unnamed protein product [Rotaria sp. Silwood1]CAF1387379.1 unnamed protein product [Rotaria sp. Silwood1]CAF3527094.1 unnamed protein product [Rotaria sp. Silwood1]CAF3555886.1 unnamed protein product [Rotaria sp. Silwood1]